MLDHNQNRRDLLTGGMGLGAITLLPSLATAQEGEGPVSVNPDTEAVQEQPLVRMGAPEGVEIQQREDGFDFALAPIQQISSAARTFTFNLRDGDFSEQTSAVTRPSGAGFVVFLNSLDFAFVRSFNSTTLTERPLGQFHVDTGLRGNNLVCQVRLTDRNADDPVRIVVTAIVLFWSS